MVVVRSDSSSRRVKSDGGTDKNEQEKMTNAYRAPPVLLHACKEFAIFSIKHNPKKPLNVNEIIELTTLRTCLSNCSIQSSDSDTSLTYRSPAIQGSTSDLSPGYVISPLADSGACRLRSQSECGTQFPKKGILKRTSICRSLSESHDSNPPSWKDNIGPKVVSSNDLIQSSQSSSSSSQPKFCQKCGESPAGSNDSLASSGQHSPPRYDCRCFAGGDCSDIIGEELSVYTTNLLMNSKKSVTFSERVEENIFRPGSSILGQRKKNQRKAAAKCRKRKESSDSMLSLEEICEDTAATSPQESATSTINDDESINDANNDTFFEEAKHESEGEAERDDSTKNSECGNCSEYVHLEKRKNTTNRGKCCKKKKPNETRTSEPPLSPINIPEKYRGFVINPVVLSPKTAAADDEKSRVAVGRLNSIDSALSVDLNDTDDDDFRPNDSDDNYSPPQLVEISGAGCAVKFDLAPSPDSSSATQTFDDYRKDSGIDEEMEQLCEKMCEAVVRDE